ncbi:MAG TPA: His/Gly/Thr/Pro-type tRNA ligase C-terminal domain-containing protein, partial [Flavisolibacter sp.]|nr:His/Gly/Thr/Pro-type tRNA ligase C-terminal domain-containing protein [Flavisolibacter sp.]
IRQKGIPAELYHETAKLDKQFKYAERKNIPYIILIGSRELSEKTATVKDLRNGEQMPVAFEKLSDFLFI